MKILDAHAKFFIALPVCPRLTLLSMQLSSTTLPDLPSCCLCLTLVYELKQATVDTAILKGTFLIGGRCGTTAMLKAWIRMLVFSHPMPDFDPGTYIEYGAKVR
jgi:hypothetical protein